MSDIKLFRIDDSSVRELDGESVQLEKSLQTLIERHLETFLGVRFLKSEHATGKTHGGRIDTLGIDENGAPVIIEYKRTLNENVINQGLFYLDWLLDHRAEFELMVLKALGQESSDGIEWPAARLICIAGDFSRYDEHAVQQINRNIELYRYRKFGDELLLFELVNRTEGELEEAEPTGRKGKAAPTQYPTVSDMLEKADKELADRYHVLKEFCMALGDDVQFKTLKYYFAFRRIRNFACVEVHPNQGTIRAFLKVDPDSLKLEEGYTRDVRQIGHFGTGDLEVTIGSDEDLERTKPMIIRSYEAS